MTSIHLKNDNIKVNVPEGISLRQVATKSGASMEFGCRVGDCATCIAKVEEGESLLNEVTEKEKKALEMLGPDYAECRLMCQCKVESTEGEIVISYNC